MHFESRRQKLLEWEQFRVRQVHEIEQEIERLSALSPNPGRAQAIKQLQKRLDVTRLNHQKFECK